MVWVLFCFLIWRKLYGFFELLIFYGNLGLIRKCLFGCRASRLIFRFGYAHVTVGIAQMESCCLAIMLNFSIGRKETFSFFTFGGFFSLETGRNVVFGGVQVMLLISVVYFESLDGSEADSTADTDISSMPEDPGDDDGALEEEDEVQQKPPLRYQGG